MDTVGLHGSGQPTKMVNELQSLALLGRQEGCTPRPNIVPYPLLVVLKVTMVTRCNVVLRSQPANKVIQDIV